MKVLGVDQSFSCTGLVICEDEQMIHAEVYKSSTEYDKYYRAKEITKHVAKVAKEHKVDYIIVEALAYGARGDATRDLGGLLYTLIIKLNVVQKYPMEEIAPTSLKKYATGHGYAKKEAMIDALPDEVKQTFLDLGVKKTTGLSDLADAFFLSQMYWREYY